MEIKHANEITGHLVTEMSKAVLGQQQVLVQMVVALLAGGHALLEGVPGTAKTLIARALAHISGVSFKRIQFTPDLMPSDIVGVNMFNTTTGKFTFMPGPIFTDIVLADEINRAPAKTQSALLEAMEERQATVDGMRHPMSAIFTVFATQNPVEFEGTYPLPEAQVDRFMLKILVNYPPDQAEATILDNIEAGFNSCDLTTASLQVLLDKDKLVELQKLVRTIRVEESVRRYTTAIVRATRTMRQVSLGASPRAAVMLMLATKAYAVIVGRDFVTPDDVKLLAPAVLRHRIMLQPEVEVEGRTPDHLIKDLLIEVEVPR